MRLAKRLVALAVTAAILTIGTKPAAAIDWRQVALREQQQLAAQQRAYAQQQRFYQQQLAAQRQWATRQQGAARQALDRQRWVDHQRLIAQRQWAAQRLADQQAYAQQLADQQALAAQQAYAQGLAEGQSGALQEAMAQQPTAPENPAPPEETYRVTLTNPARIGYAVTFRIDGTRYRLEPGETRVVRARPGSLIRFDRGGGTAEAVYRLPEGAYAFRAVPGRGWDLVRAAEPAAPSSATSLADLPVDSPGHDDE